MTTTCWVNPLRYFKVFPFLMIVVIEIFFNVGINKFLLMGHLRKEILIKIFWNSLTKDFLDVSLDVVLIEGNKILQILFLKTFKNQLMQYVWKWLCSLLECTRKHGSYILAIRASSTENFLSPVFSPYF